MSTGKIRETGVETSKIEQLSDSREGYSEGKPVSGDTYEKSEVSEVQAPTVGFKQVLPILTDDESQKIEDDLAHLARGIDMYKGLSPEEREGISAQQFAVMFAMLEAFRHA